MRDRFGLFGAVIRIRKLFVVTLRMPNSNAGYNQIFMAEEDIPKTAFRCPGHVGLF